MGLNHRVGLKEVLSLPLPVVAVAVLDSGEAGPVEVGDVGETGVDGDVGDTGDVGSNTSPFSKAFCE